MANSNAMHMHMLILSSHTGETGPVGLDRSDRTGGTGPVGQNRWDRTGGTGPVGQNRWDSTGETEPMGQDRWDRTEPVGYGTDGLRDRWVTRPVGHGTGGLQDLWVMGPVGYGTGGLRYRRRWDRTGGTGPVGQDQWYRTDGTDWWDKNGSLPATEGTGGSGTIPGKPPPGTQFFEKNGRPDLRGKTSPECRLGPFPGRAGPRAVSSKKTATNFWKKMRSRTYGRKRPLSVDYGHFRAELGQGPLRAKIQKHFLASNSVWHYNGRADCIFHGFQSRSALVYQRGLRVQRLRHAIGTGILARIAFRRVLKRNRHWYTSTDCVVKGLETQSALVYQHGLRFKRDRHWYTSTDCVLNGFETQSALVYQHGLRFKRDRHWYTSTDCLFKGFETQSALVYQHGLRFKRDRHWYTSTVCVFKALKRNRHWYTSTDCDWNAIRTRIPMRIAS
jgi:hypothetical protein